MRLCSEVLISNIVIFLKIHSYISLCETKEEAFIGKFKANIGVLARLTGTLDLLKRNRSVSLLNLLFDVIKLIESQ